MRKTKDQKLSGIPPKYINSSSVSKYGSIIENVLVAISVLFLVYVYFNGLFEFPKNNKVTAVVAVLIFIGTVLITSKKISWFHIFSLILIVFTTIMVSQGKDRPWYLLYTYYWILAAYALGIQIVFFQTKYFFFLIPFYSLAISIFIGVFLFGESMVDSGFFLLNRNVIAMFTYTFATIPTIYMIIKKKPLFIIELSNLILLVYIQFLTQSRAGLSISILHTIIVIIYLYGASSTFANEISFFTSRSSKFNKYIWLGILIIFIIFIWRLLQQSRLATQGFDSSGRVLIYKSYFTELDFRKLLLGFKPSTYSHFNHMHNSYLELMVNGGLIGGLPTFIILGLSFVRLLKVSLSLTGIYVLLIAYSMVEFYTIFLYGDFSMVPLIVIAFTNSKNNYHE